MRDEDLICIEILRIFLLFSSSKIFYILFISNLVNHSDHRFNLFVSFVELWDHTSSLHLL